MSTGADVKAPRRLLELVDECQRFISSLPGEDQQFAATCTLICTLLLEQKVAMVDVVFTQVKRRLREMRSTRG